MKIGEPVDSVPSKNAGRDSGKYAEIYKVVDGLKRGQWLPITFDTAKEAYNFRVAIETHRTRDMLGKQRKSTVYIRNREK